jgi:hypothetical protein
MFSIIRPSSSIFIRLKDVVFENFDVVVAGYCRCCEAILMAV